MEWTVQIDGDGTGPVVELTFQGCCVVLVSPQQARQLAGDLLAAADRCPLVSMPPAGAEGR